MTLMTTMTIIIMIALIVLCQVADLVMSYVEPKDDKPINLKTKIIGKLNHWIFRKEEDNELVHD